MRKTDGCINCGEVREIAARDLCFKCYRQEERAGDQQFAGVDRHNPGVRREHKKLFRGFTSVMVGLSDLGVQRKEVLTIRQIVDPYLTPIARFLAPAPDPKTVQPELGGECDDEEPFTSRQRSAFLAPVPDQQKSDDSAR